MKYREVNSDINCLNLGCGYRFNNQWTNVDFVSTGKDVIAFNLIEGIPFADNTFELVYHSHVLEHFPRNLAKQFIQECYRVLKPQGVLRIVVPDLEQAVQAYLAALQQASSSPEAAANHEWMTLELLDQLVRRRRGGDMANYLSQDHIPNKDFIVERFGAEAERIWLKKQSQVKSSERGIKQQIKHLAANLHEVLPKPWKKFNQALQIGYFLQSGEVHQWMYDRYSLAMLLANSGLSDIVQRGAGESYVEHWSDFNLDTEPDGRVYKPDSLFMEALKT